MSFWVAACSTTKEAGAPSPSTDNSGERKITLNQGKKWRVPAPMMAHIRKLEQSVTTFDTTQGKDHPALANEIQENLGRLVTSCTLEGEAHDQLHKWLMPVLGLSAEYVKATDHEVQQNKFLEIKKALLVFHDYFE